MLETAWDPARVAEACSAAEQAALGWARLPLAERWEHLVRLREAIAARSDELADAIVCETGKLRTEARGEVGALLSRFDLVRATATGDLHEGPLPGRPHEELRYHPLGVVAVIGPFNYPMHLCHAHAIPALLLGNPVVVKPSEITPLCGQRYAEAAEAAGLPPGVFNLVQGRGATGAALVANEAVRGLCFTGSYAVGRKIKEAALDRPALLVALEMGGKNTVVVAEDADVRQAAHEIVVGGYLTTGQRCTATDRALVHESRVGELVDALVPMVESLRFGDPDDPASFAGPLATEDGRDRFEACLEAAGRAGAEGLVACARADGGLFVGASLHRLPAGCHDAPGYTDTETFGPDVGLETYATDDEAIAAINASAYGFANAVFTASEERFERFYRETRSGILNRNRSTNLASPRLPFGGVGKSGNYRPAGAHASRNVVAATAVQDNVLGTVAVHPLLAASMPEPDFARLEARHAAEEAEEASRTLLETPRPLALCRPHGGRLPSSDAWLIRLYAGDRVVREKKPAVFDHLRSFGPWFVSVDDAPLSVLDGMSQTATLCGGFGEDAVVLAYVEGRFGHTALQSTDTSIDVVEAAQAYANTLRHLVPGLPSVTFANSGAEANEKALALCRQNAADPKATRVLAFEGGFHGRTLLALHATWNPAKREPFEIDGYQAMFAPFPVWERPADEEPAAPAGFYAAAGSGDVAELESRFGDADEDPLLAAEAASLAAVHRALATGEVFACIVEPMQAEGGDRYATARFFRALRLLTRHHGVALVFDEVQTGFGLGGPVAWHTRFQLVNFRGQPDAPDAVTFAKRAQVGVVMSAFDDPEPTATHTASLVRGRLHAEMVSTAHGAERIEKLVRPRLEALAQAFPDLVTRPRARGYAFAFDLPTAEHMKAYLGQRFWRGAIVFGAGTRTIRYRLSETFLAREVVLLFDIIRRSLAWLEAHPGAQPPAWEDPADRADAHLADDEVRVRAVPPAEALELLPAILDIEYLVYEPARRTPPQEIRAALEDAEGATVIAEARGPAGAWELVGFALGAPLETSANVEGPDRDPFLGRDNTMYSVSITVVPDYQGKGLGRRMKERQLREAAAKRTPAGAPRYRYVTGRNRVGHTASMTHLNRVFGAHLVCVLTGQYEDPEGQAIYYRIPLGAIAPDPALSDAAASARTASHDLAGGIARPLAEPPASLARAEVSGLLYGPTVNKLTVMNYATPGIVRALEWIGLLYPELPHLYLTSSRDETVDKSLRILRWHRAGGRVAIGLDGGYVGHTTAAARSITDPAVHRAGPAHFDWPRVAHPAEVGADASIAALRAAIEAAGGADRVLGLYVEPVQERTGHVIPAGFWPALEALRADTGIPVVAVETASASYRSGRGPFASSGTGFVPDLLTWWGGAQTGYIHCSARLFVAKPLTMVSTWDGDELSLIRQHHELRALRRIHEDDGVAAAARALDEALDGARARALPSAGLGLYRVLAAGSEEHAAEIAAALDEHGLRVRVFPGGRLAVAPGLDEAERAARALGAALREIL